MAYCNQSSCNGTVLSASIPAAPPRRPFPFSADLALHEIHYDGDNSAFEKTVECIYEGIDVVARADQRWLETDDIAIVFGEGHQQIVVAQ